LPHQQQKENKMTDMELLDYMVRKYLTQSKMANALKLGDSAISNWRKDGKLPNAWRMYFLTQFNKHPENLGNQDNYANNYNEKNANFYQVNNAFNALGKYRSKGEQA
jgi:hypothetical protein